MSAVTEPKPKTQRTNRIDVSCDPAWKRKVERAAKRHPGSPTVSAFVRVAVDKFMQENAASAVAA